MAKPIYLDYNATTPMDPSVVEAMLPFLKEEFGNPASRSHAYGWDSCTACTKARKQVADLIGAPQKEILFTSGATESNNMAILGLMSHRLQKGHKVHMITSEVEHKAVLDVCKCLESRGADLTVLPVNQYGQVAAEQVDNAIQEHTVMVSLMMANNEVGSLNPIKEIGAVCKAKNVWFHTDAAQAVGKTPIHVKEMGVHLLSGSAHKMYGPKGVGFLYVQQKEEEVPLKSIFCGGAQEMGLRPGTLNVPGIVALGKACEVSAELMPENSRFEKMRDEFINEVLEKVPEARLNGHPTQRTYSNVSFSFEGMSADMFALGLSGLAVSSGSACTSETAEPSHVIKALGHSNEMARATLRVGIGRMTTPEDLKACAAKIVQMAEKNRKKSST